MSNLAKFQSAFGRHLLGSPDVPVALAGSHAQLEPRLSVYRNNVFYSLTNALGDLYPVVKRLVGDDYFQHLAKQYLLKSPPTRASMVHFGGDFPGYLRDELGTGLAYLSDVARLELARHEAFHAADSNPIAPDLLQQLGTDKLLECSFILHPSVRLLSSPWAIRSIWSAHQQTPVNLDSVNLDQAESVLVLRPTTRVNLYAAEPALISFLELLNAGINLSTALEKPLEHDPEFDAGTALAFCIKEGVFTDLRPQDQEP